jgi:hypothetical protein
MPNHGKTNIHKTGYSLFDAFDFFLFKNTLSEELIMSRE